jgi:hypothetical protein
MAIGRRICDAIQHTIAQDYERAFLHLFPAVDATARRRRNIGVGARIRKFLSENEAIIQTIASPGLIMIGCRINGRTWADALYTLGRTAIAHEGQLDPRLQIADDGEICLDDAAGNWRLPSTYLIGISAAVITAPENAEERCDRDGQFINFGGTRVLVNELWGQRERLLDLLQERYPQIRDIDRLAAEYAEQQD